MEKNYITPKIYTHKIQTVVLFEGSTHNEVGNAVQLSKDNFFHFIGEDNGTDEDE